MMLDVIRGVNLVLILLDKFIVVILSVVYFLLISY